MCIRDSRRTGQRAIMFGMSNGLLDLRYVPYHMDVKVGDVLETSGLDNIYPAGFPIAKVVKVDRNPAFAFTQIHCEPLAAVENSNEVLVLNKLPDLPEYPSEEEITKEEVKENKENKENKDKKEENKTDEKKDKKENKAENKIPAAEKIEKKCKDYQNYKN